MSNRSDSSRNELDLDGLPRSLVLAALDVLTDEVAQGLFMSRSERELRQELNLWLKPSWIAAQELGIRDVDFAEWIRLGEWNLSNKPTTHALVKDCTAIAGSGGWRIKAIGMTPSEAFDKASHSGVSGMLEEIDALLALKKMSDASNRRSGLSH